MGFSEAEVRELQAQVPGLFQVFREIIPWLHAIGIGEKVQDGLPTNRDSIVFFVGQKLDIMDLAESEVIPGWLLLEIGDEQREVETDVVEMPPLEFTSMCYCKVDLPAKGGNCVAPRGAGWTGTLGGVVTDPQSGKHHIVSNAHILSGFDQFPIGYPIVQPNTGPVIGHIARSVAWTTTGVMGSDSAIAEVDDNSSVQRSIHLIGLPAGLNRPALNMSVQKSGARTCWRSGIVKYVGMSVKLNGTYTFRDVFCVDRLGESGDSGSLVLDRERNIVGLLFGQNPQYSACNDIKNVVDDLMLHGWLWT